MSVGCLFACGWWFTDKNWVLNDVLSFCIVLATVQLFKITSMRMAFFYFVVVLLAEVTIALCIHFLVGQSYNILILNNFNNPMEIQLPSITRAIDFKCSWLPVT